jgi:hypothetical protein
MSYIQYSNNDYTSSDCTVQCGSYYGANPTDCCDPNSTNMCCGSPSSWNDFYANTDNNMLVVNCGLGYITDIYTNLDYNNNGSNGLRSISFRCSNNESAVSLGNQIGNISGSQICSYGFNSITFESDAYIDGLPMYTCASSSYGQPLTSTPSVCTNGSSYQDENGNTYDNTCFDGQYNSNQTLSCEGNGAFSSAIIEQNNNGYISAISFGNCVTSGLTCSNNAIYNPTTLCDICPNHSQLDNGQCTCSPPYTNCPSGTNLNCIQSICQSNDTNCSPCTGCNNGYQMCPNNNICTPTTCPNNTYGDPCNCSTCQSSSYEQPSYGANTSICYDQCSGSGNNGKGTYAMDDNGICNLQCPLGQISLYVGPNLGNYPGVNTFSNNNYECIDYSNLFTYKSYENYDAPGVYDEKNVNYTDLIPSGQNISIEECKQLCSSATNCVGYTYNDFGCFPKKNLNFIVQSNGSDLYVKQQSS